MLVKESTKFATHMKKPETEQNNGISQQIITADEKETYLHNSVIGRLVGFQEGFGEHCVHCIKASGVDICIVSHTTCDIVKVEQ